MKLVSPSLWFGHLVALLRSILYLSFCFALLMGMVRGYIYLVNTTDLGYLGSDLLDAFVLGARLDVSVLAYIAAFPILLIVLLWLMQWSHLLHLLRRLLIYYYIAALVLASFLLAADLIYYIYFAEHMTVMVFGFFDDDTLAQLKTVLKEFNVSLYGFFGAFYLLVLVWGVNNIFNKTKPIAISIPKLYQALFFLLVVAVTFVLARGSLGMFPLSNNIPDVSKHILINKLPQNGVFAAIKAYEEYRNSKKGDYDLIKMTGYSGRINEAYETYLNTPIPPSKERWRYLLKTTPKQPMLEAAPKHVVVVMVESFGLPILEHQSSSFDVMRRLKRHFDEDILFRNIISTANGTIVSLEPMLLNIVARPNSTPICQSPQMHTPFQQSAARVYQHAGYETHFVYGGDLSWRNIGTFTAAQGFDYQHGKADIAQTLGIDAASHAHDWGIFDQYAYDFVLKLLQHASKPQFIFLLTTNNHPPYTIPNDYISAPLNQPEALRSQIIASPQRVEARLRDYQYALDMAGRFMDAIKSSALAEQTVVAITADNNTIESMIHYDDFYNTSKKIPFYLYLPQAMRPQSVDTLVPGSHKDIFPTLYHLTLSNASYIALGSNLLDPNVLHCGFNSAGIINSRAGAFKASEPKNEIQARCDAHYKASLAVGEDLLQSAQNIPRWHAH